MPKKLERRTVRIPQGARMGAKQEPIYGYQERPADCLAGLCVHRTGKGARWRWMVSHVASGLALERLGGMTKAVAVANMRQAVALDFDWTRGEAETLAALRERRDVVDAITTIGNRD